MADIEFRTERDDLAFRPAREPVASPRPASEGIHASGSDDLRGRAGKLVDRATEAAEEGRRQVAGGMDRMGDQLDRTAHDLASRGGMAARASGLFHEAGEALDSGADYVRSNDLGGIRDDITDRIRSHPLLSVGVAIGAGYLLSKVID